jgi:hypothetical protein
MKRLHLFEFEDLHWFPVFLRNYITDFLQFIANLFDIYKPVIPLIEEGLTKGKTNTIIDLASGGGGGLIKLCSHLKKNNPSLKIVLTDYYPNIDAFKNTVKQSPHFEYIEASVNALNVPLHLKGLRTQFLSFHHFKPAQALSILQNAITSKSPIAIFEIQERSLPSILSMIFSPIAVLIVTPMIRPFKWGRILFTYLIPLCPLFVLWDGIVSSLRTYSINEMNELINRLHNKDSYEWQTGKIKSEPGVIIYLLGNKI